MVARRTKRIEPQPLIYPSTTTSKSLDKGESKDDVKRGPINRIPIGKSWQNRKTTTTTKNLMRRPPPLRTLPYEKPRTEKEKETLWDSLKYDPWSYIAPLAALLLIASVIAACMELCRRKEPIEEVIAAEQREKAAREQADAVNYPPLPPLRDDSTQEAESIIEPPKPMFTPGRGDGSATPTWSDTGIFPSVGDIVRGSTQSERVPVILRVCTRAIEARWLKLPELYKRTGEKDKVDKLLARLRSSSGDVTVDNEDEDTVVGVVMTFLQQIAEPLIHKHIYEKAARAVATSDKAEREKKLKDLLNESDQVAVATLAFLIQHLRKVYDHSNLNGMTRSVLATVFTPFVVGWGTNGDTSFSIMIALLKLDTAFWSEWVTST